MTVSAIGINMDGSVFHAVHRSWGNKGSSGCTKADQLISIFPGAFERAYVVAREWGLSHRPSGSRQLASDYLQAQKARRSYRLRQRARRSFRREPATATPPSHL